MAKSYEKMRNNENMGYCRPYIDEDGLGITIWKDEVASRDSRYYGADIQALIEGGVLRECGCSACPFRDYCEAMEGAWIDGTNEPFPVQFVDANDACWMTADLPDGTRIEACYNKYGQGQLSEEQYEALKAEILRQAAEEGYGPGCFSFWRA